MNYGQFVRFAEKTRHLRADKLTQITVYEILSSINRRVGASPGVFWPIFP